LAESVPDASALRELLAKNGRARRQASNATFVWAKDEGVAWHFIAPGKPMQKGYIESFNGRTRL
jgi:transposase InsO family protein